MAALNEEQTLIRDQAKSWASDQAPVQRFRAMRDSGAAKGFDPDTWSAIVDLGWTGIIIPEQYGGSDLGYLTFGLVLEELGRQLTASPLFASGLVGATAVLLAGNDEQKAAVLPRIVDGSDVVTLAVDEGPHHAPEHIALRAEATSRGYRLDGKKTFVPEGLAATQVIVAARTAGSAGETQGITLFLVPTDGTGITLTAMHTIDSRGYAQVEFSGVEVDRDAILGPVDGGYDLLMAILDRARAGLSADMLGTAAQAFDLTLDYLKTRKQFGQVIGSFQGLGHRASELYSSMELARSCAEAALQAIDARANNVAELCALSQAKVGGFLHDMSNQLIQIHGGIGMTDEFDAGLYLKRARVQEALYGNRAYHRNRYASLLGF